MHVSLAFVCLSCMRYFVFVFFSCYQGLAADCDCGTPCTFHLIISKSSRNRESEMSQLMRL